jgi:hypothetical protein
MSKFSTTRLLLLLLTAIPAIFFAQLTENENNVSIFYAEIAAAIAFTVIFGLSLATLLHRSIYGKR